MADLPKPAHYWRDDVPVRAGPLLSPLFTAAQLEAYADARVAETLTSVRYAIWAVPADERVSADRLIHEIERTVDHGVLGSAQWPLYTESAMLRRVAEAVAEERAKFPNLTPVIQWLENGCDPLEAAKELRIYQHAIRGAANEGE